MGRVEELLVGVRGSNPRPVVVLEGSIFFMNVKLKAKKHFKHILAERFSSYFMSPRVLTTDLDLVINRNYANPGKKV